MTAFSKNVLLTGAGFTKNFGCLLGTEVWDRIFNNPLVREHLQLVDILKRHNPDFETAYQVALAGDYPDEMKTTIKRAVEQVFSRMDDGFLGFRRWEDVPSLQGTVDFICEFAGLDNEQGYFFTLNQDLFIERFVVDKTVSRTRGHRQLLPLGIPGRRGFSGPYLDLRPLAGEELKVLPSEDDLPSIQENARRYSRFSYVKLHGSMGWYSSDGRGVMVIGGGKEDRISQEPLLQWYLDLFGEVLCEGKRRLVVIGYSFRDNHINRVIAKAIQRANLDLAVISPKNLTGFEGDLHSIASADENGSLEVISRALLQPGSRFFHDRLIDIFPPSARGESTSRWSEIREYLRS